MKTFNEWIKKFLFENYFQQSYYKINGQSYSVPKLAKWSQDNIKPVSISIDQIQREYISSKDLFIDVKEEEEWFKRSMNANLMFPILLFRQQDGKLDIIDGNHRVWKAWKTGVKEIKAYIFDSNNIPSL